MYSTNVCQCKLCFLFPKSELTGNWVTKSPVRAEARDQWDGRSEYLQHNTKQMDGITSFRLAARATTSV